MAKIKSPAVSFYDGCILERDVIYLCGKLDFLDYDDYSHSRTYSFAHGTWGGQDFPWMIIGVCAYRPENATPTPRIAFALAEMAGRLEAYWKGGEKIEIEVLPGAEEKGGLLHLMQVKQIGNDVFVVGIDSQVYRRHNGKWEVFSQGLEGLPTAHFVKQGNSLSDAVGMSSASTVDLFSIDGSNFDNLYAVGRGGVVCHKSDGDWRKLEQVTNVKLHRVKYVDENTVFVAGDKGILLKGNAKGFHAIQTGINDDFWGLEWFNGKLYIGTKESGIFEFDGKVCHKVTTTPKIHFECHTLNAFGGQMLALGSKDIFFTDDCVTWRVIEHPDNQ